MATQTPGSEPQHPSEAKQPSRSESRSGQSTAMAPRPGTSLGEIMGANPFTLSPFGLMRRMMEDMDRMFEGFGLAQPMRSELRAPGDPWSSPMWSPQVELLQRGDEFVIRADLPGINKDDLRIQVQDNMLVLEGERRSEQQRSEGQVHRTERSYGRFRRAIAVPAGADLEHATATYEDGVLEICLKCERPNARTIEIKTRSDGDAQPQDEASRGGASPVH
jgi:HSP20 family protein